MDTIVDKFKEYIKNTSIDKILSDCDKSKEWDEVGMSVYDFIELQQQKTTK